MTPDYADYRDTPVFLALFPSCYARLVTRIARIVVPGAAHQVTQHGNRRERVFFEGVARARFETGKDERVAVIPGLRVGIGGDVFPRRGCYIFRLDHEGVSEARVAS